MRVFVDHCVSIKENARLEKVLPVVTAHAFRIQDAYNSLLDSLATTEEAGGDEEVTDDREFVLAELLHVALNLDYADEIGRRRLEQFVRKCQMFVSVVFSAVEQCAGRPYDIPGSPSIRARHPMPRCIAHPIF